MSNDPINPDPLKPDCGAFVPTDELFDQIIEMKTYFWLERSLLHRHSFPCESNPYVWRCQLAAPADFEAVGSTPNEALKRAIAKHKKITQGESKQ